MPPKRKASVNANDTKPPPNKKAAPPPKTKTPTPTPKPAATKAKAKPPPAKKQTPKPAAAAAKPAAKYSYEEPEYADECAKCGLRTDEEWCPSCGRHVWSRLWSLPGWEDDFEHYFGRHR